MHFEILKTSLKCNIQSRMTCYCELIKKKKMVSLHILVNKGDNVLLQASFDTELDTGFKYIWFYLL